MACRYSKYDGDSMRFKCKISGDECVYLIPNEQKCEEAKYMNECEQEGKQ